MKRLLLSVFLLAAAALPAPAHFIWVLPPQGKDTKTARIIFSESLKPDSEELLKKIEKAEVFARGVDGKTQELKKTDGKQAFHVTAPSANPHEIGVVLHYGVSQRGDNPPVLLNYYAKGFTGINREKPDEKFINNILAKPWDKLPLEIVPVFGDKPQVRVLWQGKPAADVEVTLYVPGTDTPVETKTDKDGLFKPEQPMGSGVYGFRARYVEKKEGELDGKKYKEVRHYATMTFPVEKEMVRLLSGPIAIVVKAPGGADPAATKLLFDARAARAEWENFPGFTADAAVNLDGKVTKGKVLVKPNGDVKFDLPQGEAQSWAVGQLKSVVGHRLSTGTDLDTPCVFADDVTDHPLGRAIKVLNDEFHSSYRIKDRQVIEVNRRTKDSKFTITVLENQLNEEKKYLPSVYIVTTWSDLDAATGSQTKTTAYHQEWKRVGKFDLPSALTVVTPHNGKLEARSLALTNLKLQ